MSWTHLASSLSEPVIGAAAPHAAIHCASRVTEDSHRGTSPTPRSSTSSGSRSQRMYPTTPPSTSSESTVTLLPPAGTTTLPLPCLYEEFLPKKPCPVSAPRPTGSLGEDIVAPRLPSSRRMACHRAGHEHGDRRPRAHRAS
jgi:hypothetical protein